MSTGDHGTLEFRLQPAAVWVHSDASTPPPQGGTPATPSSSRFAYCSGDLFHPSAIGAQIAVADPGGRTEVDLACRFINLELHVVDKPEQGARKFHVQVIL